ncbi:lipopolysaccharide biosynthesis protein [Riemerella anatipestifer]|uniref:lipopolysaccharide biosynthesis protein n=1 Tax=Riemerella anatipestifer TaxID=34085 RepID=UPI00129EB97C|nr:hypothetical protein [Riemerella anatipestifer]MCT6764016.1 hypothetical protein [Riemerella anatipestifer]MCT6768195.1 hypothetical protein [Riemerella anatipestifer]MCU7592713.1 hypothetical protein [Riemerella anatipestifer]MCU7601018.1 hypothetical protein [Riemerella anatipestifer]MCU7609152.1 hypothetical protein [Riemerella anatipestifer]
MLQVKRNLLFNIVSLVVNIIVGFLYTPYLVDSLGIVAYGIVPLAMIVSEYISILTTSLTGSLTRFYSVRINNGNYEEASSYLSGALVVMFGIILICIPIISLIIWKLNIIFNIPNEFINSAKILITFTFLSFLMSLVSSFFGIVLYANNRIDLLNKINILRVSSKVLINVLLFELLFVDVKFVGIGGFIGEILVGIYSYFLFKKVINQNFSIKINKFEGAVFSTLFSTTLWIILHQIGDLAIYKTDILFVNKFWNTSYSGILGAISSFGSYIMMLIGVISSLFGPLILIAYSKNNHKEVKELALNNSLLVGLLTALIVSLLIGYSYEFLELWLGSDYAIYHSWLDFKLVSLPFYASSGVFAFVYRSWDRVRFPALTTVFIGLVTIVSTYMISFFSNGSTIYINYILIFNSLFCVLQTFVLGGFMFRSIYSDIAWSSIVFIGIKFIFSMVCIVTISRVMANYFAIYSWLSLTASVALSGVIGFVLIYFVFMNSRQREYLYKVVLKK